MAARRDQPGHLTATVVSNQPRGNDRSPGFHAVWTGGSELGHLAPTFGYYVRPATKITAKVGGRTVEARQATWSEDPQVVIFWFDSVQPGAGVPSNLSAYDADGRKLPAGNTTAHHG